MTTRGPERPEIEPEATGYAALTSAVRDLVRVMREGDIGRLEIKQGDLHISLTVREPVAPAAVSGAAVTTAPAGGASPDGAGADDGSYIITAPMIGTFYAAPAPGERPFVEVGDRVEAGQTIAIIEAMKIMNEIVADRAGVVEEIFVSNGEAVEYGHPLMRLRLAD